MTASAPERLARTLWATSAVRSRRVHRVICEFMVMANSDWNPDLYRRFEDVPTRPARERLGCVPLERPALVQDPGCGQANWSFPAFIVARRAA